MMTIMENLYSRRTTPVWTLWTLLFLCSLSLANAQNFEVNLSIQEENVKGTFVGNVSDAEGFMDHVPAEDRNSLIFSFLQQTSIKSLLSIHDDTGSLYTTVVIDRESLAECKVPPPCVLAFDIAARSKRIGSSLFEIISVKVTIEDINDNAPIFPKAVQVIAISEAAVNGSSYLIDSAIDEDTANYSVQSYTFVGNTDVFALKVEKKLDESLSVKLVVIGKLDRESKNFYSCTIIAKDGGLPPKSESTIVNVNVTDENDNAPVFMQTVYNITVKEDTADGVSIVQLSASDSDIGKNGLVLYRFSQHQSDLEEIKLFFFINEHTGVFSIIGQLVYVPGKIYRIIVEAVDEGTPPLTSVNQAIVTVNIDDTGNHPPMVSVNLLSTGSEHIINISESATIGTFVAYVEVLDSDTGPNGNVSCSVGDPKFSLEQLSKKGYKIVIRGALDREKQDMYTVTVICVDQGIPAMNSSESFLVRVTDENDNVPVFSEQKYIAAIFENNNIGDVVIMVSTWDADIGVNAKVTYFLDSLVRDKLTIDPNTGVIKALTVFDRETNSNVTVTVFAKDLGVPSNTGSATVSITIKDVNDNAPKFSNATFRFSVRENQPNDTVVNRLTATDDDVSDNAMFTFAISDTNESSLPFTLFADGVIKTSIELDRERKCSYQFIVIAIDKGVPKLTSSARIVIDVEDVNDNSPKIYFPTPGNHTVTVSHLLPIGSFVAMVDASDMDEGINAELSYVIEEGNTDRLFMLHLTSGILSMASVHEVNAEKDEMYNLVIAVHDGGTLQRSERCEISVIIKYDNMTQDLQLSQNSAANNNIVIVIIVILLTFFMSLTIIIVICVIRKLDKDRMNNPSIQINKLPNNLNEVQDNMANGIILGQQYDKVDDLRKKKEVSFSFEDDFHSLREHEISFSNNSVFADANEPVHSHKRQQSHQMKTFQLQQHLPLGSHSQCWKTASPQTIQEVTGSHRDNHSDTSRETVTSDSGRGTSDDDLPLSHKSSSKEENYPSSCGNCDSSHIKCSDKHARHLASIQPIVLAGKCSVPLDPGHHLRPQSADFTNTSSAKNRNQNINDRSLSNLAGCEKPKFTVLKPYVNHEADDKKPEGWRPSYV